MKIAMTGCNCVVRAHEARVWELRRPVAPGAPAKHCGGNGEQARRLNIVIAWGEAAGAFRGMGELFRVLRGAFGRGRARRFRARGR
jgi:hypothetical protein